jgi:hypothetical protein
MDKLSFNQSNLLHYFPLPFPLLPIIQPLSVHFIMTSFYTMYSDIIHALPFSFPLTSFLPLVLSHKVTITDTWSCTHNYRHIWVCKCVYMYVYTYMYMYMCIYIKCLIYVYAYLLDLSSIWEKICHYFNWCCLVSTEKFGKV